MTKVEAPRVDLVKIAHDTMLAKGLSPDFPPDVLEQLDTINEPANCSSRDMTDKLWFSIDNDDSRDLDQLTYAEKLNENLVKIYVAIADVDALVKKDSPLDKHAFENTTSVYTPMVIYPMLPEKLSTDLTSLNPDEKRVAIVVEMDVDMEGKIQASNVYQACVYNYAKLAYNSVGPWLEKGTNPPQPIEITEGLAEQIRLQDQVAQRLKSYRFKKGALTFETYDPQPVIINGKIVDIQEVKLNRARELIENFMISANNQVTLFLEKNGLGVVKRVVKTPKRWDRIVEIARENGTELPAEPDSKALESFLLQMRQKDPLRFPDLSLLIIKLLGRGEYVVQDPSKPPMGHFALALTNYTHATAPNRRYPDLIVQRLIKARLDNKTSPYSFHQLEVIMSQCTDRETRAEKVKRSVMKSVIALYLQDSVGKTFDAFVTGSSEKGTWVRIISTAIEGKLVGGNLRVQVGQKIKARLISVNIDKGFLDFENEDH